MSKLDEVTATCFCGAVQLVFSLEGDNLLGTVNRFPFLSTPNHPSYVPKEPDTMLFLQFVCHCTDDRKLTSSMFASNFIIKDDTLKHVKGQDKLTQYTATETIISGDSMISNFCSVCGSLMYRVSSGFPGLTILRIGQVDDFKLHETVLKPRLEQFGKDRVNWVKPVEGMEQFHGSHYPPL